MQQEPDSPTLLGALPCSLGSAVAAAALACRAPWQVMLGSGEPALESWMAWAESAYKDKFRGWVGFSVPVAHRITAG